MKVSNNLRGIYHYRQDTDIEATMPKYDRKKFKNLRIRGMEAVRFCNTLNVERIC